MPYGVMADGDRRHIYLPSGTRVGTAVKDPRAPGGANWFIEGEPEVFATDGRHKKVARRGGRRWLADVVREMLKDMQ